MLNLQDLLAWAAQTTTADATQTAPPPGGGMMTMILGVMVVMILYTFLISNPKRKAEEKKREEAMNLLGRGDKVITTAGIHGTVDSVEKEKGIINVTIAPKVVVAFSRSHIASYTKKDEAREAAPAK